MNHDYSFNNKYKLFKVNNASSTTPNSHSQFKQYNANPVRLVNRTNTSSVSPQPQSQFKLVKTNAMPTLNVNSRPNLVSSVKTENKASINLLNITQSIESSNKLDDLLKRCREIGKTSSDSSINSEKNQKPSTISLPTPETFKKSEPLINNKFKLIANTPSTSLKPTQVKITRYSLNKLKSQTSTCSSQSSSSSSQINTKLMRHKYFLSRFKIKSASTTTNRPLLRVSKFKLINSTNKKPVISLSRFKLINQSTKQPTKQQIINRKNLFKLNNVKSIRKIIINKRFKLVKETEKKSTVNPNQIVKKYKMLTTTKLIKSPIKQTKASTTISSTATNSYKLNNKNKKYCLFYNRFGRCSRGDSCKLIHDPKRIAICPRFLRGTCKLDNCPFSHTVSAEKTPLCSFFASGCCNRPNCPYSHVYLGKNVDFCLEFAKGFCSLGSNCKKTHLVECPDFKEKKKCPRGKTCPLIHRSKNTTSTRSSKSITNTSSPPKRVKQEFGASFISFDETQSIASLSTDKFETVSKASIEQMPLKTRPSFGKKT